jgi:hypothetical protein
MIKFTCDKCGGTASKTLSIGVGKQDRHFNEPSTKFPITIYSDGICYNGEPPYFGTNKIWDLCNKCENEIVGKIREFVKTL